MTYQKNCFEITEITDENGNRTLTHISGEVDYFIVPDGIYAIKKETFDDVRETLRKIFITASVKMIEQDTFKDFRNPDYFNSSTENKSPLEIECEADSRPDGFFYELIEDSYEEDYEFYYETYLHSWLGSRYLGTGTWEDDSPSKSIDFIFPKVRWGCEKPRAIPFVEYTEVMGEVIYPDSFFEKLAGLSIEEQKEHFRVSYSDRWIHTGWSERESTMLKSLNECADIKDIIIKDGYIAGVIVEDAWGNTRSVLPERGITINYECDNNGAGYKESTIELYLLCV